MRKRSGAAVLSRALPLAAALALVFGVAWAVMNPGEAAESAATQRTEVGQDTPAEVEMGDTQVQFAGMTVSIDPETGRLRQPTKREIRKLRRAMQRMFSQPGFRARSTMTQSADGVISAVLDPSYLNFSVARIDEQGAARADCVSTPEEAVAFMAGSGSSQLEEE